MIIIDYLKNHLQHIHKLAEIWQEVLGKIWLPDVPLERVITKLNDHLNNKELPLTFIVLDGDKPVGMCSLRENDGIRPDLRPWLGSLVVDPSYQKQGIAKMLIGATIEKAKSFEFQKLYLFAFDPIIPDYYARLSWEKIGADEFKSHRVVVMSKDL